MPSTSTPRREARPAIAPSIAIRWSPRESSSPPSSPPPPRTANPSGVASMSAPSARSPSTTPAIRSDSFTRSSSAPRTTVSPSAKQPRRATSGSSSIASGTSAGSTVVPSSGAWAMSSSPTGSSVAEGFDGSSRSPTITAPIRSAIRKNPVRVQLSATPSSSTRDPGTTHAAAARNAPMYPPEWAPDVWKIAPTP